MSVVRLVGASEASDWCTIHTILNYLYIGQISYLRNPNPNQVHNSRHAADLLFAVIAGADAADAVPNQTGHY